MRRGERNEVEAIKILDGEVHMDTNANNIGQQVVSRHHATTTADSRKQNIRMHLIYSMACYIYSFNQANVYKNFLALINMTNSTIQFQWSRQNQTYTTKAIRHCLYISDFSLRVNPYLMGKSSSNVSTDLS